jgi:heme exporter protein D
MNEFLDMGGYGAYVWSAFGITALVLVANVIVARSRERQLQREIARQAAGDRP